MSDVFMYIWNYVYDVFEFAFNTYNSIIIYGDATLWDFIIVILIAGAIPVVIASAFGSGAIASGISSTVNKSSQIEQRKLKESRKHYKERIH